MGALLSDVLMQFLGGAALEALQKFVEESIDAEFAAWFVKSLGSEAFGAMVTSGDSQETHLQNLKHLKATAITKLANLHLSASQRFTADTLAETVDEALDDLAEKIKEG